MTDHSAAVTALATLPNPTPTTIRDELTQMVIRDLLGPAGGIEEELNQYEDHAYQRYLVGMLAPKDPLRQNSCRLKFSAAFKFEIKNESFQEAVF